MKITIKRAGGGPMRLAEFADLHGFEMVVNERAHRAGTESQFYAQFDGVEVKDGACLIGLYGNGTTPEDAIAAYSVQIRSKRLVWHAFHDDRREVDCPTEWLP